MDPHNPATIIQFLHGIMGELLAAGAGILVGVGAYLWKKRDDQIESKLALTVYESDQERYDADHNGLKEAVCVLDEKFDCFSRKMEKKMEERGEVGHKVELALTEIRQQLGRLVSDIDSEKRTRIALEQRIEASFTSEIRALRHAIRGAGRRREDPPETFPPIV